MNYISRIPLCVVFAIALISPLAASAADATVTLRSKGTTVVDAINSLTLTDSFISDTIMLGEDRAALVFGMTFSISAYDDALRIPLRATAHESASGSPAIKLALKSRFGHEKNAPFMVTSVIPHTAAANGYLTVAPHTTGEATILVAYAGTIDPDRLDSVVVSSLPLYAGTSTLPIMLNRSEVRDILSKEISLEQR